VVDQSEATVRRAKDDQIFAQNPDELGRMARRQFFGDGDRMPVAAEEFAGWSTRADARQQLVFFVRQHTATSGVNKSPAAIIGNAEKICKRERVDRDGFYGREGVNSMSIFSSRWISPRRSRTSLTCVFAGTETAASRRNIGVPLTG